MANLVLTDADVNFASNDISGFVKSVTLNYEAETQDDTVMGDDTRSMTGGLKAWSVECELVQDFAAAQLDSILFPLVGTTGSLVIKPTSGAVSTSNPSFTGTALLVTYPVLGNTIGELARTTIQFANAGTMTRATS